MMEDYQIIGAQFAACVSMLRFPMLYWMYIEGQQFEALIREMSMRFSIDVEDLRERIEAARLGGLLTHMQAAEVVNSQIIDERLSAIVNQPLLDMAGFQLEGDEHFDSEPDSEDRRRSRADMARKRREMHRRKGKI